MTRQIRAVLFDAAGTLMRVREPVGVTYARIARDHGVVVSADRVDSAFGPIIRNMPPMVFASASAAETIALERAWWSAVVRRTIAAADPAARFGDFAPYFDAVFRHFAKPAAWVVTTDAHVTLTALRDQRLATGMVSNFDHRLPGLLDGLGLTPLLDVVIRPADVGAAKPDPRIFHAALRHLDVRADAALYVGDDEQDDVGGALAAGLHAINVAALPRFRALLERLR